MFKGTLLPRAVDAVDVKRLDIAVLIACGIIRKNRTSVRITSELSGRVDENRKGFHSIGGCITILEIKIPSWDIFL